MATLLLRLAGPMQSWGTDSKLNTRMSGTEPSKSGVIGMIAAAQGRSRTDSVDDLASLKFGVRIDQKGQMIWDYHTAHNKEHSYITKRAYLSDAVFLVGLEGEREIIEKADAAVRSPFYPLFLGRRSCPPAGNVSLGIRNLPLNEALHQEPWLASDWYKKKNKNMSALEVLTDSEPGDGYLVRDVPVSFSQERRRFAFRTVKREETRIGGYDPETQTEHDAFSQLRGD